MPPKSILHDAVDQVVKKLPAHCATMIRKPDDVTATRDLMRLISTKAPVGILGQQDRAETRAAVLLDYVVRSRSGHQEGATFPLKDLAKSVGLKEATFKKLHGAIGHYYHDVSRKPKKVQSQSSGTKRKESAIRTKATVEAPPRKQSRRGEMPESIFPSLAIRLASHLSDPNGVARRARILFHEIYAHALSSLPTVVDRRGQEHDFRRYWSAYQASVLYHEATTTGQDQTAVGSNRASKDEESAVRPLKLDDLVKACPDCTYMELKEKIVCVTKWADEINQKYPAKAKQQPASKQQHSNKKKNDASVRSKDPKQSNRSEKESNDTDKTQVDFDEWKKMILEKVLEQTRASVDPAEQLDPNTNGRSFLLQRAADAILAKYELHEK